MKILAAVVTHNRCELLERCIDHLQKQTHLPDLIVVINNASTDGTVNMLMHRNIDCITQDNVGSAGGWYRCISYALEHHFDAVWLMDDDGFPNATALKNLSEKLVHGVACVSSVVLCENDRERLVFPLPVLSSEKLPVIFSPKRKLKTIDDVFSSSPEGLYPYAHFFNGALVSCDAVKKIGNVDKNFFIAGDEIDYFYRLRSAGKVYTDISAHHYHPDVAERPWSDVKIYYYIKNTIILNKRYFNMVIMRNFMAVVAALHRTALRNGWSEALSYLIGKNLKTLLISIWRGLHGQLEKDFHG